MALNAAPRYPIRNSGGIENVQRGFNFGQQLQKPLMEQQKEDAATAEKFAKMTSIDQSVYSAPRRELAKQAVDEIMGEVWFKYNELEKQKKGAGANYLRQPETQSKIYGLQQKLKTYQDQTQRDKAFLEGVQKGQYQADPELVRILSQGTADELRNYQSRFGGVRENLDLDYATYKPISVEDEVRLFAGTEGVFSEQGKTKGGYNTFRIPKNQIQQFAMSMAAKEGGVQQAYFMDRKGFDQIYDAMAKDAQRKGLPIDERALMLSTAAEIYNQKFGPQLAALEDKRLARVPRASSGGGGEQDLGVSELVQGSFTVNVPTVSPEGEVKSKRPLNVTTSQSFTVTPKKALVANTKNIYDFDGNRIDDPNVQNATYGQFALIPVYKKGAKSIRGGRDLSGRIVPDDQLNTQKNLYEYLPVAIGEYTSKNADGVEVNTNVYRPLQEVEGAILSSGSKGFKAKVRENFQAMKDEAARLNKTSVSSQTTNKSKQKQYKATDITEQIFNSLKEGDIIIVDGVERIKQGGALKKVKR